MLPWITIWRDDDVEFGPAHAEKLVSAKRIDIEIGWFRWAITFGWQWR